METKVLYIPKATGHHMTYAMHFQCFSNSNVLVCSPDKNITKIFQEKGFQVCLTHTLNENIPDLSFYLESLDKVKVFYTYAVGINDILNLFRVKYSTRSLIFMSYLGFGMGVSLFNQIVKYILITFLLIVKRNVELSFLEDLRAVRFFERIFSVQRVHLIPDPIINSNRYKKEIKVGHFGTLCKRKGSDLFLKLSQLYEQIPGIRFVMAGKVIDIEVPDEIPPNLEFIQRVISEDELFTLIDASDFIILPYRELRGSSGVLINSLANSKFVIGPRDGLIGRLGRQSIYYIPVNTNAANDYNKALNKALFGLTLQQSNTPKKFVESFLR